MNHWIHILLYCYLSEIGISFCHTKYKKKLKINLSETYYIILKINCSGSYLKKKESVSLPEFCQARHF